MGVGAGSAARAGDAGTATAAAAKTTATEASKALMSDLLLGPGGTVSAIIIGSDQQPVYQRRAAGGCGYEPCESVRLHALRTSRTGASWSRSDGAVATTTRPCARSG